MNKYLPLIGIGVIILVAAGAYLVLGKNKSYGPATTTQEEVASEKLSIKDLIAAGGSQQCSFSDENSEGMVYFNDKKMRGDFKTTVEEKEVQSNVIIDENTMYTWVEGQKTGFKATFNISDEEKEEIANENIDLSKKVDYKCSAWSVDSSVFTPPADVKFTDFGAFTAPSTTSGNPANCSVCNSLQGDSKMQCLQALKC